MQGGRRLWQDAVCQTKGCRREVACKGWCRRGYKQAQRVRRRAVEMPMMHEGDLRQLDHLWGLLVDRAGHLAPSGSVLLQRVARRKARLDGGAMGGACIASPMSRRMRQWSLNQARRSRAWNRRPRSPPPSTAQESPISWQCGSRIGEALPIDQRYARRSALAAAGGGVRIRSPRIGVLPGEGTDRHSASVGPSSTINRPQPRLVGAPFGMDNPSDPCLPGVYDRWRARRGWDGRHRPLSGDSGKERRRRRSHRTRPRRSRIWCR
jgi:hypothetical protein